MTTHLATIRSRTILLLALCVLAFSSALLSAAPDQTTSTSTKASTLKYKVISGFKQPFNDELQLELSKGWTPVGGISVTVWNNDLYFAQLISKPTGSQP